MKRGAPRAGCVSFLQFPHIETALELTHDNRTLAAATLGRSRQNPYVKLRGYRIDGIAETERH